VVGKNPLVAVCINKKLAGIIDEIVKENEDLDFQSRADFVRCAIREKLNRMGARGF
jgi:hypothetical protein